MNRALFAVKASFNDSRRFFSFMWRFWALMDLVDDERLRPWCQPTDDGSGTIIVHPAMLDVARRLRLGKRGAFNVAAFRKLLDQSPIPLTTDRAPSSMPGDPCVMRRDGA